MTGLPVRGPLFQTVSGPAGGRIIPAVTIELLQELPGLIAPAQLLEVIGLDQHQFPVQGFIVLQIGFQDSQVGGCGLGRLPVHAVGKPFDL